MATRASDGAGPVSPHTGAQHGEIISGRGGVRRILALDGSADRRQRLDAAIEGIRPRPEHIVDLQRLSPISRASDIGIALVGVDPPDAGSASLDTIATLTARGFTVLCYGDGASGWPLGAHCRLLLAGASCLIDSTAASFATEIRDSVEQWCSSEAERFDEEQRLQREMLASGVVGASAGMTTVFRWVKRVSALSDIPVLVAGETGTGKELVARAIHARDPRRSAGPFVPVNCAAISAGVAESELFGHRRGAFTGADHDRQGLVRAARGGVLFLDEIGDLDVARKSVV